MVVVAMVVVAMVVVVVVSLVVVVGTNDIHMRNGPLLLLRNREKKLGERMQP